MANHFLAEAIDRIIGLSETKTFEIKGQTYADKQLSRIVPHVDRPAEIPVNSLDSICKLILTEKMRKSARKSWFV